MDIGWMAERVGFEPTVRKTVHQISSLAHSTTLTPFREAELYMARRLSSENYLPGVDLFYNMRKAI